jgi:hypothetical protein
MAKPQIDLKFGADLKDFRRGISNIDRSLSKMSTGFTALGGVIGASFAVDAIRQFTGEAINLASQAEGVKRAFDRINDPLLLSKLRKATKGTIADLELMKMAVKAKNFNIPLNQLGNLLGFAQQRATETGESIDYMAESIVLGIARKSIPILDNLGFSATQVREEFNKTGDMATAVGNIIEKQMGEAGDATLLTSERMAQQRAEIDNLKTEIGEGLLPAYNALLKVKLALVKTFFQPFGEAFAIDDKTEEQLRNQLALLEKRIETNKHDLALYPKNSTYIKNVTRLEEYRQQTLAALNSLLGENVEVQEEVTEKIEESTPVVEDNIEVIKKHNEAYFMAGESMRQYIRLMDEMSQTAPMAFATITQSAQSFVDVGQQMHNVFMGISDTIGTTLAQSFEAAIINGEDFFTVFIQGLKVMLAQIIAVIAAAAVLALVLTLATGGLAGLSAQSFMTAFRQVGGGMGVPSFMMPGGLSGGSQSIEVFGRLSGSDILLSGERAGRNRNRSTGIGG